MVICQSAIDLSIIKVIQITISSSWLIKRLLNGVILQSGTDAFGNGLLIALNSDLTFVDANTNLTYPLMILPYSVMDASSFISSASLALSYLTISNTPLAVNVNLTVHTPNSTVSDLV